MLSAGDIVLLDFPYTNQAGSKVRPGLVLGMNGQHGRDDVNVAYVTSEVDRYIHDPAAIARSALDLTHTDNVMNNTFWIGVQPALTQEMLEFAAQKIDSYLGVNF